MLHLKNFCLLNSFFNWHHKMLTGHKTIYTKIFLTFKIKAFTNKKISPKANNICFGVV